VASIIGARPQCSGRSGEQPPITSRTLFRNSLLNLIGQVVPLLVGVAAVPFIVRGLGPERFGLLSIAWVVLGYSAVLDLGISRASTKFVAEALAKGDKESVGSIVATAVVAQGILGAAGGLTFVLAAPSIVSVWLKVPASIAPEATEAFRFLGLAVPLLMVSGSLSGALQGAQRFDLVNAIQVPTTVGIYLAALFGAWLGFGLFGIIVLIVVVRGVALVGLLVVYTRCLAGFRPFPASMFRALLSFGGWVSVSNVVGPILVYADRVLLGSLVSAAAVGYYAAPYEVVTRALWVLPTAISTTLFPGFSAWTASGDRRTLSRTCGRAVKYLLLLVGGAVAVLVVFADFVLHFWLGPEYAEHSTWAMRILSVGVLINSLATVPYAALQGSGRPDLTAKFHLLELPVYIVAAWFLVSLWDVTGAAVAWSARAALDGALLFWASRRFLGVSQESFYEAGIGKVLTGLLGFGLILAGVKACSIYVGPLFQWSVLVLIGVSLLGVSWAALLDDVDRRLILAWVRRR